MPRGTALSSILLPILASACVETSQPSAAERSPSWVISDAVHGGGNSHFFWLPPMVAQPASFNGPFDATVSPTVHICNLANCGGEVIAEYSMETGPGSETVRLAAADEHFIVNWHTDQFGLVPGTTYRISVRVAGTELGLADVQIASGGKEAKNLTTSTTIGLKDGRTLPIIFRVEEGAVFVVSAEEGGTVEALGGAVTLEIPAGALAQETGITVEAVEATDGALVAVEFGPSGLQFAEPVPVTLAYNPAALPPGLAAEDLALNLKDAQGRWVILPGSTVNTANHTVTAPFHHFSEGGVGPAELAVFCSGDSNPDTFEGLDAAVTAIMADGTVEVCGGSHVVNDVVIDRPMTLRPVSGASPVLVNTGSVTSIWIDGVSSGTVLIDGMTFELAVQHSEIPHASSIRAQNAAGATGTPEGTWDQVIIRNSTFRQSFPLGFTNSTNQAGVAFRESSVAGARGTIENSSFTMNTGLAAWGELVNITGSTFQTGGIGVLYNATARGRVENSAFGPCGQFFCVYVVGGAQVDIVSNTFTIEPLTGASTDLQNVIRVWTGGSAALVADNDFVGCSRVRCVLTAGAMDLLNNRFVLDPAQKGLADPGHSVVWYSNFSTGTASGNQLECWHQCFTTHSGSNVVISNNTMSNVVGLAADAGIVVLGLSTRQTTVSVLNNVITGQGNISDPMDPGTYPFSAGVAVQTADVTEYSGNTVTGAAYGLISTNAAVVHSGRDNLFQNGHTGVVTFGVRGPGLGRVTLGFSDFTQYVASFQSHGDDQSILQCNYWGSAAGPNAVPDWIPTGLYAPWAIAPIAGTGASSC